MMTRTLFVCLMAWGLAFSGGCAYGPWLGAPFGPGTLCDPGGGASGPVAYGPVYESALDSSCCSSHGPALAPVPTHGPACSMCGEVHGGTHDSSCSVSRTVPYGPLTWLFDLLHQGYHGNDGNEIWWGDWHGAPPDCFDPCDRGGNYTGGAGVRGGPGACESCGQDPSGHVHRVSATAAAEPEVAAGRFAPRLISTTDRAVTRSIPQKELPRQRPANQ